MRIFYDKEKSMELMRRIEDKFGEKTKESLRGKEIHVYDLVSCPLKAYCRIIGIERRPTRISIGVMVFGIISENVLAWTFPEDVLQYKSHMNMLEGDDDIFGHIDIFELEKYPLEVKSSRKQIFKADDIPVPWVEQLMSYMAMQGAETGWLVLFNVFSTQIMAFRLVMTKQDILDWLILISTRSRLLREGIKDRNPEGFVIHPKEYEYCDYKHDCPRQAECRKKHKDKVGDPEPFNVIIYVQKK